MKREKSGRNWWWQKSVCSGELNFNLVRVIQAMRTPSGYDFHSGRFNSSGSFIEETREINNFPLTSANSVFAWVSLLDPQIPLRIILFALWLDSPSNLYDDAVHVPASYIQIKLSCFIYNLKRRDENAKHCEDFSCLIFAFTFLSHVQVQLRHGCWNIAVV